MTALDAVLSRRLAAPVNVRVPGWPAVSAIVLAAVTWPIATLSAAGVTDYWQVGLHLAAAEHLAAGRDVVFTYGPLGFLAFPLLVTPATGIASFAFAALTHLAVVATVLRAARRRLPAAAALVVAGVAGTIPLPPADAVTVVVLGACVAVLADDDSRGGGLAIVLGGAVCALELLVKLNDGILCLALAALAAWRLRPRGLRSEALLAGSFCFFLAVFWRAAGSPLAELPGWLRLSAHLLTSYAQGMRYDGDPATLRTGVVVLAALVALGLVVVRDLGRRRGLALLAALAIFGFAYFKEGFVRPDGVHTGLYFAALASVPLLVGPPMGALLLSAYALRQAGYQHDVDAYMLLLVVVWLLARRLVPTRRVVAAAVTAAAAIAVVVTAPAWELPSPNISPAAAEIATLASPARRAQEIAADRDSLRIGTPLPQRVLHALRGHTVDVEPYGATIAWAYGLRWAPEPLLESYAAYDPALDRFAAGALAARGAQRILLRDGLAIDRQEPLWEAPALILSELCNYERVVAAGGWSVLARDPGRCSAPRALGSADVERGWVGVPQARPGELVYAQLQLRTGLANEARALLLRPHPVWVDMTPAATRVPIVPASAADPLLMRANTSFAHIDVRSFRVSGATGRVRFFAVSVSR